MQITKKQIGQTFGLMLWFW